MKKRVAILAPRKGAAKILPAVRLAPGPALVILDGAGKIVGALQKKISAKAVVGLLRGRK